MLVRFRRAVVAAILASAALTAPAQEAVKSYALEHGPLVVWWVVRATQTDRAILAGRRLAPSIGPPRTSVEKTMAEFGTAASDTGQTSSSYGQTPSTLGQNAGSTGQASSNVGQTAGSFGRTSSTVGQTAGSYGQSASSLGQSAGSFGESIAQASQPVTAPGQLVAPTVVNLPQRRLEDVLRSSFPGIEVRFLNVLDTELKERLERAQGTTEYPDVVVGVENLAEWRGGGMGLTMLGVPRTSSATEADFGAQYEARYVTILRHAPHLPAARAFVVWVRDQNQCGACMDRSSIKSDTPAEVIRIAKAAVSSVLQGANLGGDADKEAAEFDAVQSQNLALTGLASPTEPVEGVRLQVDAREAIVRGQLAMVEVRSALTGAESFGVTHSLVVLRRDDANLWKVLQVTANLSPGRMTLANADLQTAVQRRSGDPGALLGVSLAAPADGDNRPAQPELWWDNKGGATLQAVEWQAKSGSGWLSSSLEMVPDQNSRLRTQVVARFAQTQGLYRWRVWSVGGGGSLTLSPWRTFSVIGR